MLVLWEIEKSGYPAKTLGTKREPTAKMTLSLMEPGASLVG